MEPQLQRPLVSTVVAIVADLLGEPIVTFPLFVSCIRSRCD